MKINIINKHHLGPTGTHGAPPNLINIMRPNVLGNPFPIIDDRDAVVDAYDEWLEDQLKAGDARIIDALDEIATLAMTEEGVNLLCCCSPKRCHGDVIKRYVINASQGKDPWAHSFSVPSGHRRFLKES